MKHFLKCEAPICSDTKGYDDKDWRKKITWFPDEKICLLKPYTNWQRKQIKIQSFYKKAF